MRFSEFKVTEAEQPGFYAVGDSHAVGIATANKNWINKGVTGAKSTDSTVISNLSSIPDGSTIALSVGHNDSTGTNNSPEEIASHVDALVNQALSKKMKVYFVLFPTGNKETSKRNTAVRNAIYDKIKSKTNVLDLNRGTLGSDGIHLTTGDYQKLGNFITGTMTRGVSSPLNIKGGGGPGATVSPGEVASYLKSKGMDNNHILGILANIKGESGFRAGVMGDGNTSGGLFQHHADRFTKMVRYAGSDWKTDWRSQIDFALSEPPGQQYIRTPFSSPQEATSWWVKYFEKPANIAAATNARVGFLKNLA